MAIDRKLVADSILKTVKKISPIPHTQTKTHRLQIPFNSSVGTITERDSLLFSLRKNEFVGIGEAAPLPGYSKESLSAVKDEIMGLVGDRFDFDRVEDLKFPASRFAVSAAIYDLLAKIEKRSIASFFTDKPLAEIPVNALNPKQDELKPKECIKLKVSASNWGETLKKVSTLPKNSMIRLDANQQFTKVEAISVFKQFREFNVEYVEEPFKPLDSSELDEFKSKTNLSVALDETLYQNPDNINYWIKSKAASAIVIKPTFLGSLDFCRSIIANSGGKKVVISSAFEYKEGIRILLQLAASVGDQLGHCGLDTLKYFEFSEELSSFKVRNGSIHCLP